MVKTSNIVIAAASLLGFALLISKAKGQPPPPPNGGNGGGGGLLSCNLAISSSSIFPGESVKFDGFVVGESGTAPYSYKLYIDEISVSGVENTTATMFSHSHTFMESGDYTVKLEVTDSDLNICTKTGGITVAGIKCQMKTSQTIGNIIKWDVTTVPQGGNISISLMVKEPIRSNMGLFTYECYKDGTLISSYKRNEWWGGAGFAVADPPGTVFELKGKVIDEKGRSCTKIVKITVTEPISMGCAIQLMEKTITQNQWGQFLFIATDSVNPITYTIYRGTEFDIYQIIAGGTSERGYEFAYYQFKESPGTYVYTVEITDVTGRKCKSSTEVTIL